MINLIMKPSKRNQTVSLEYSCCKCGLTKINYILSNNIRTLGCMHHDDN